LPKNFFQNSFIFLLIGVFSSFLALALTSLYGLFLELNSLGGIIVSTVTEELSKLLFLSYSIYYLFSKKEKLIQTLWLFIVFGIGFALLESIFIWNAHQINPRLSTIEYLLPSLVHLVTSLVLGLGIFINEKLNNKKIWISLPFIIALLIHLAYNLFVLFF